MIEIIEDLPDNVVGLLAKGVVTRKDYLEVVLPAVEKSLKRNAKLRLYYDLGSQFTGIDFGAEWEDFKIGIEHFSRWERIAVVTESGLESCDNGRAIAALLEALLARPDRLHGEAGKLLGDRHHHAHIVRHGSAAKRAADIGLMDLDLLRR